MGEPKRYSFDQLEVATGGWALDRRLGEGGFGAVYRALLDGRTVAIKRLTQEAGPGTAAGLPSAEQFEAEVRKAGAYNHPNLLPVIGYCDEDGGGAGATRRSCIIYPLMVRSLEEQLAGGQGVPDLPYQERVRILAEVFSGIVALHDPAVGGSSMVHRDIKTANVLLDKDMRALVGDFGLVRNIPKLTESATRTHTETVNIIGTQQYMAPEFLRGGTISSKMDVFACGIVALELLTGRPSRPDGDASRDLSLLMQDLLDDLNDDGVTADTTHRAMEWVDRAAGWPQEVAMEFVSLAAACLLERPKKRIDSAEALRRIQAVQQLAAAPPAMAARDPDDDGFASADESEGGRPAAGVVGGAGGGARAAGGGGAGAEETPSDPTDGDAKGLSTGTLVHVPGAGTGVYVEFKNPWVGANSHVIAFDSGETEEIKGWMQRGCKVITAAQRDGEVQRAAIGDGGTTGGGVNGSGSGSGGGGSQPSGRAPAGTGAAGGGGGGGGGGAAPEAKPPAEQDEAATEGLSVVVKPGGERGSGNVKMGVHNQTLQAVSIQFYHEGNLGKAHKIAPGMAYTATTYFETKWRVFQDHHSCEWVIERDHLRNPQYIVSAGAAMARKPKKREPMRKVHVHVCIPKAHLSATSTVQAKARGGEACVLESLDEFSTRSGAVALYKGTLEVPVSTRSLRYRYRIKQSSRSLRYQDEWLSYAQTDGTYRIFELGASEAVERWLFDDEILLDSGTPRVKALHQRYAKWIWGLLQTKLIDVDTAADYLWACSISKRVDAWRITTRGDESTDSLKAIANEVLLTCAGEITAGEETIAAAALLTRWYGFCPNRPHPRKVLEFSLQAWCNDRSSLPGLSQHCRERTVSALVTIMNEMHQEVTVSDEWMLGLPLLHSLRPEPAEHGLSQIKIKSRERSTNFEAVIKRLRPLFASGADPYLAKSCFVGAPYRQAIELVSDLPTVSVALTLWVHQLDRLQYDGGKRLDGTLDCLQMLSSMMDSQPRAATMPDACAFLQAESLAEAIRRDPAEGSKVIRLTLELVGAAARDDAMKAKAEVDRAAPVAAGLLRPLVAQRYPAYTRAFFDEFDVWQRLMDTQLPGIARITWQEMIRGLLSHRLKAWDSSKLLELFCDEQTERRIKNETYECLLDEVNQAVQELASLGAASLSGLLGYRGSNGARLFSTLINQAWENASRRSTLRGSGYSFALLRHTLQWALFPSFFSAEMEPVRPQLNPLATERLKRVSDLVDLLPRMLTSGGIAVEALNLLIDSGDAWKNLVRQVKREGDGDAAVATLEVELVKRRQELRAFEQLKGHILDFDNLCNLGVELRDRDVIKRLLAQAVDKLEINKLSTAQAGSPTGYHSEFFLPVTQHIQLDTLERLHICRDSLLFQQMWEAQAQAQAAVNLQLSTWEAQMWTPLLAEWNAFRDTISTGTMTVDACRERFKEVINRGTVAQELRMLSQSTRSPEAAWVAQRTRQLVDITKVDRNVNKGRAILRAAETLRLNLAADAEFAQLQTLLSQEYGSRPLADLTTELVSAFDRIEEMTDEQADCVDVLARWPDLVKWMRPYKDTAQFETFTSLANAWVEQADEIALMSDLHTVRTGCRRLLYEVNEGSSFKVLVQACSDEALKEKALRDKIENCAKSLDKLEELQNKSQQDVKGTSLVQAKAIYETGTLHIVGVDSGVPVVEVQYKTPKPMKDADGQHIYVDEELVYHYESEKEPLPYEGDGGCKDLRSKLMLVSSGSDTEITAEHQLAVAAAIEAGQDLAAVDVSFRKKKERAQLERVAVERFVALLEAAEAIVEVLQRLQDAGCLAHSSERFEYNFLDDTSLANARAKRAELARSFDDWLKQIDELRHEHYQLNAFSIVELTHLIRLGRRDTNGEAQSDVLYRTLALLQCVSKAVTLEDANMFCDTVATHLPTGTVLDHEATRGALEQIGRFLKNLADRDASITQEDRSTSTIFSQFLKENMVNVLVGLSEEETLASILSIYAPELPNSEQLLLCAPSTTAEAVKLLFRRCLSSDRRTFCLGDVQNLSYESQVAAVEEFEKLHALSQASPTPCQFRLILMAQTDDTHLCTALNVYNVPKDGFDSETRMTAEQRTQFMANVFASSRPGSPCVLRVSGRAGDGKTRHIVQSQQRLVSQRHNIVLTEEVSKDAFVNKLVDIQDKLWRGGGAATPSAGQRADQGRGRGASMEDSQYEDAIRVSMAMAQSQADRQDSELEQALRLSQVEAATAPPIFAPPPPRRVEPDEGVVGQLVEMGTNMGFAWSTNGCKRAAVRCDNDVERAVSWCMEHSADPDFNEPLEVEPAPADDMPLRRHRSSSSRGSSSSRVQGAVLLGSAPPPPSQEQLGLLTVGGLFSEAQAQEAWARRNGDIKKAGDYLFRHQEKDDDFWRPRFQPAAPEGVVRGTVLSTSSTPSTSSASSLAASATTAPVACPKCTLENAAGANFCNACGEPLVSDQTPAASEPARQAAAAVEPALVEDIPSPPALPAGWEMHQDPSGRTYYMDHNTQTTHWYPPAAAQPPTAPLTQSDASRRRRTVRMTNPSTDVPPQLFIIDVSPTATGELSHMLFQLLMQSEIRSSDGRVFHRRPQDVFIVEHTLSDSQIIPTLDWLLLEQPLSPTESIEQGRVEPRLPDEYHRVLYYFSAQRNPGEGFAGRTEPEVECLRGIVQQTTINDPTWQQLTSFVNFLSRFLEEYETNPFCGPIAAQDLPGFGAFVVEFLKVGARDFSLPSLGADGDATPGGTRGGGGDGDGIDAYTTRRQWEKQEHPYISFVGDGFDFFGFHVDQQGNHTDAITAEVRNVMPAQLSQTLYLNYDNPMRADYHDATFWTQQKLRAKLFKIMGLDTSYSDVVDATHERGKRMNEYILTGDNIKKILAIMFRFRVGIPVALCGHTGCGKTALVQYMCDAMAHRYNPYTGEHNYEDRMIILKVHGGTTKAEIREKVCEAMALALTNNGAQLDQMRYTVLFFDEVNTCDHQGYIKSLVCDNMLDGELIPETLNLRFVCALNPYEKHTDEMIERLKHAGLGYSVGSAGVKEKIGGTPMRHLVYRVQQLPKTLRQCVWDFGTLTKDIEDTYINEMVRTALKESGHAIHVDAVTAAFSYCLSESQKVMREMGDECSFVSLRDIERALTVFLWFYSKRELLKLETPSGAVAPPPADDGTGTTHPITKCIVLSLSVCYYFKLEHGRPAYLQKLAEWLQAAPGPAAAAAPPAAAPPALAVPVAMVPAPPVAAPAPGVEVPDLRLQGPNGADQIQFIIKKCQALIGRELQPTLPDAVALNDALCENCFLMIVAIETRTPLFLVGKPGSSKSLAKNAVCDAMHGTGSESELFKKLKHVTSFSYQCSPLSKSEEIKKVFEQAQLFQDQKDDEQSVSVVVLDEIGLAEDSEYMPLKVLHSLLEPSDDGKTVGFLGISNWALDPAKMNRGIHVNRSAPSRNDLVDSARGICNDNPRVRPLVSKLAEGYSQVYEEGKAGNYADFFGLRDFYTLIKMLASQRDIIDAQVLDNVVRRNFDGIDGTDGLNQRCGVFHSVVFSQTFATWSREDTNATGDKIWTPYTKEVSALLEDAHVRGEARVAIDDERYVDLKEMRQCREDNPSKRWRRVQRTEAAQGPPQGVQCASPLDLIRDSLLETGVAARYLLVISQTDIASSLGLLRSKAGMLESESSSCEVIFGSSFPGDGEYQHLCRNINRVKICMEMGKTVVLLNLRSVMESLYELLNQYFIEYGKGEDKKRFVEIALGDKRMRCSVHADFRLVIIAAEEEVLQTFPIPLLNRLEKHTLSTAGVLEAEDNADANAAVTEVKAWACAFVSSQEKESQGLRDAFVGYSDDLIPSIVFQLVQSAAGAQLSREELVERTKDKLLQMATPDAVLRVAYSGIVQQEDEIKEKYFRQQPHSRLREYIRRMESTFSTVTTHEQSPVPSLANVKAEASCDAFSADCISTKRLGDFDSEREFEAEVKHFFSDGALRLLIVQCRARDLDLLTNAKYIVQGYGSYVPEDGTPFDEPEPEPEPDLDQRSRALKHVVFLVHLPQKSMSHSYTVAVDGWEPMHLDCILPPGPRNPLDATHLAMTPMRLSAIIAGEASITVEDIDLEDFFEPEPEPEPEVPSVGDEASGGRAVNVRTLLKDTVQAALAKVQNPNATSTRSITALIRFLLSKLVPPEGARDREATARLCDSLLKRMLLEMMTEKETRMENSGEQWVKVRAKDVGFVQKSGTFRGALYSHLQQNITSVFAAVLTALSTNDNLSLLVQTWDNPSQRDRWLDLAESNMFSVQNEVALNTDPKVPYVVATKWKQGSGPAQSAFSWILFATIQSLRTKMEQLASTKTPLQCLREELSQHSSVHRAENLWLAGADEEPLHRYTEDFVRQNYSVASEKLAGLFKCLIIEVAKIQVNSKPAEQSLLDQFTSTAPLPVEDAGLDIPAVHCAAWSLDTRLEQLALLLSPATSLGNPGFIDLLHATLMSMAGGVTMTEIDMAVLRACLECLELSDGSEQAARQWSSSYSALRAPVESWIRICKESIDQSEGSVASLQAELHNLDLRYHRLRCTHLFVRVTGAHANALQLYTKLGQHNPFEPDTLSKIRLSQFLMDDVIKGSEADRFPGGMECTFCYSLVRNGVALPACRHVFCSECITQQRGYADGKFKCPYGFCENTEEGYTADPNGDPEVTKAAGRVLALRDSCTQFFLEYVAEFMAAAGYPRDVVESLWPIIVDRDMSFNREPAELELQSSPAMCAYLLRVFLTLDESAGEDGCTPQLLLEKLQEEQQQAGGPQTELLTLVTEALEDVFSQRIMKHDYASSDFVEQLSHMVELAEELSEWDFVSTDSKWLQGVAAMRIILKIVAQELHHQATGNPPTAALVPIVRAAAAVCDACNANDRGAFMHLLKCILQAQWGGRGALLQVASHASETPAQPFAAMITQVVVADNELPADQFVVQLAPGSAAQPYAQVLQLCRDVQDPTKAGQLKAWVAQHQQPAPAALLCLAVVRMVDEEFAIDASGTGATKALGDTLLPVLSADGVMAGCFPVITDLLNNGIGADASRLRFSADQVLPDRQLMLLCLHGSAAFASSNALAAPLAALATNAIANSYLPTMQEDVMDGVRGLMAEGDAAGSYAHWYTCPNGHPYYIGNCGGAMMSRPCPECGATIGGANHSAAAGNQRLDINADNTPKGYALTEELISAPMPERALTLSGVALARVILHTAMLSAVVVGPTERRAQAAQNLGGQITGAPTDADGLAGWLTERLRLSLAALAKVISRNIDDSVTLSHIVLNRMLQHDEQAAAGLWAGKPARKTWEETFERTMVTPIVADLDKTLQEAAAQIESAAEADEGAGTSRRLLTELVENASAQLVGMPLSIRGHQLQPQHMPQLWRYRTPVTVSHFKQRLASASEEARDECMAVTECTKRLTALSAMRYLPDILYLQRALVERLERRISQQDAAEVSLQAKLDELWSGAADAHERAELGRCVENFLKAWEILRPVVNSGADTVLQLDDEMLTQELDQSSLLHFFIPATSDDRQKSVPGQIGVAMANCLLNHHNQLVRKLAVEGEGDPPAISVRSACVEHLITLDEPTLLPILFANVDRTVFEPGYGRGTKVEYSFSGVETAIRYRFISGKPLVQVRDGSEIMTRLAFRNDVHAGHITAGLKQRIPQEALPPTTVASILTELAGSVDRTSQTLRALETAIGFLHNSHGDGDRLKDMLLQDYLADVLMMEDDLGSLFGKVAAKKVALKHILALMQALDQQQAQDELETGRDTFLMQPAEYKAPLEAARAAEIAAELGGVNCHKLAPLLRTFILEHMTKDHLGLYQPAYLLVDDSDEMADGVLELLDELEEFWPVFGALKVRCEEVVAFWKLVVAASGGGGGAAGADAGGGGGGDAPVAGTMGFRMAQVDDD